MLCESIGLFLLFLSVRKYFDDKEKLLCTTGIIVRLTILFFLLYKFSDRSIYAMLLSTCNMIVCEIM